MRDRAEVAIIGSGITGLSVAYSLLKKGCTEIVILEKGHMSSGASTRNGGGVRAQFATEDNIVLAKWSIERFKRLGRELNVNFWFRQRGYLFLAESEEEMSKLEAATRLQHKYGLSTKIVDCNGVHKIVPGMVCTDVIGGAFRKADGVLFPFPLLFGYADHLRAHRVSIETHCPVQSIAKKARGYEVRTSRGSILADKILNAAGGWSSEVCAMLGVELPTEPIRHQIMASEPLAPFLNPMVVTLKDGFYVSQGPRGELVGGITEPAAHGQDPAKSGVGFCEQFSRRIVSLFPRLAAARMMRQWAGFYDMSPDANPILDELPASEGAFVACGYSGHGFMLSPAVGEFMSCLILGDKAPFPADHCRLSRFQQKRIRRETLLVG